MMRIVLVLLTASLALGGAAAVAGAQTTTADTVIVEGLALPRTHRYEVYDTNTKIYTQIPLEQVPQYARQGHRVYDRTAKAWVVDPRGRMNQRYVASGTPGQWPGTIPPGQTAVTQPGTQDGWQRIHGRVQSISGEQLTLRADDGRMLTVEMGTVSQAIRQALQPGEGVTVIGHEWTGPNRLRAQYVQQDSSDPSRGGAVAPSASPPSR
jgi:hypothetical protein